MTIHHPQIRGNGQVVIFNPGQVVQGNTLGNELVNIAYYNGMITDNCKINKEGHVVHHEDKTERATAQWRKHFK